MQKILRYLIASVFFLSCGNSKHEIGSDLAPVPLEGKELPVPGDSLGIPKGMVIEDSIMIFYDVDDQFIFKMVNLNEQKIIGKFGLIGRGPGEFQKGSFIEKVPGSDRLLGVFNYRDFSYYIVPLDSVLKNNHYRPKQKFGRFDFNHQRLSLIDTGRFLGTGLFKERYIFSSAEGAITQKVGEYPFIEKFRNLSPNDLGMAMQGNLRVKPDGKKFVMALANSPNMEIYKVHADSIEKEFSYYQGPPKFTAQSTLSTMSVNFHDDNVQGYKNLYVTEDYIYLLYSGRTKMEYGTQAFQGNTVIVYNWEGEEIGKYQLQNDAHFIAVDENDRFLYALSYVDELYPKYFYYDLKAVR